MQSPSWRREIIQLRRGIECRQLQAQFRRMMQLNSRFRAATKKRLQALLTVRPAFSIDLPITCRMSEGTVRLLPGGESGASRPRPVIQLLHLPAPKATFGAEGRDTRLTLINTGLICQHAIIVGGDRRG